jgi:putative oxidoreductase
MCMTLVRFIARPMLASLFIVQGLKTLRDPDYVVQRAKPVTDRLTPLLEKYAPQVPTETRTLVRINAAVHVVGGAMLATGTLSRVAAAALAGSMVPTTLAGHPFWDSNDPDEKRSQRLQFLKNVGMTGGLLLAAVDTEGRPGIPWRARRAALDARRMAKTAKREARLTARATRAEVKGKARELLPG